MEGLLLAFAHPDDEAFGTAGVMARAIQEGGQVTLVCATRGEVGQISDPSLASAETLGEVREAELRTACRELGVGDVRFLGYRDSGMAGTPDNADPRALARAEPDRVTEALVAIMREVRPQVVITFEPQGIYEHPDHVAMSLCVTQAFDAAGDAAAFAAVGPPYAPARLFYVAIPRSVLRRMAELGQAHGWDLGPFRGQDLDRLGVPDDEVNAIVDVRPWLEQKRRAIAAHATQIGPDHPMMRLPDLWREEFFGREYFVQARGPRAQRMNDLMAEL